MVLKNHPVIRRNSKLQRFLCLFTTTYQLQFFSNQKLFFLFNTYDFIIPFYIPHNYWTAGEPLSNSINRYDMGF